MPDEYSVGGGKLKLKGSKVSDGRIEKKKKKAARKAGESQAQDKPQDQGQDQNQSQDAEQVGSKPTRSGERSTGEVAVGKTETERRYEETRRKRLQERLQREGVKTHKERVEELNKYLSRLSEHHDMPKIGPG